MSATGSAAAAYAYLTSLGVGLLMGLERERRPETKAGLRTFSLVAVLGTSCAMLAGLAASPWLLPAALLALAATMITADRQTPSPSPSDTTTTVALLLCFGYGAMLWYGQTQLTVALALATTALLYFKTELHEVSRHLSRQDMVSFLQFAVISCIVLPLLPDDGYGPYAALNPYRIWLMVVLVAGIGLAGYAALRIIGHRAPPLLGLLGGLVSSTATTLVFSRNARAHAEKAESALVVVLTANLVLLVRIVIISVIVAPSVLRSIAIPLALALVAGASVAFRQWKPGAAHQPSESEAIKNPLEMNAALSFGAIYGIALLTTAWLNDRIGTVGVYVLAPVLGLTDMDAITLSTLKLFSDGGISAAQAAIALGLALGANVLFKAGIAYAAGGSAFGRRVIVGFLPVLAGLSLGLLISR